MTNTKSQNKKSAGLKFVLFICLFGTLLYWVTSQEFFLPYVQPIKVMYTKLSSMVLNIFGQGTTTANEYLNSPSFSLSIRKGCDAVAPMIIYILAILAFPIDKKYKPKGIFVGLLLLFILNIARIVSLFFIGKHIPSIFEIMHTNIWQILFILVTLIIWTRWLKWATQKGISTI